MVNGYDNMVVRSCKDSDLNELLMLVTIITLISLSHDFVIDNLTCIPESMKEVGLVSCWESQLIMSFTNCILLLKRFYLFFFPALPSCAFTIFSQF